MRARFSSVVFAALAFGCTAAIPDGRFGCMSDSECPPGLTCQANRLCYRADSSVGEASVCPAARCVDIRVVHAGYGLPSPLSPFTIGGASVPSLSYGQTSSVVLAAVNPDATTVTVRVNMLAPMTFNVTTASAYTVILSGSSLMSFAVNVLPEVFTTHPTSTTIQFVSVVDGAPSLLVSPPASSARISVTGLAMPSMETTITDMDTVPIHLLATDASQTMLAAFLDGTDVLPRANGSFYFIVLSGRTDRHLGAPDGLRMIPGVSSATASPVSSGPIAWMLNGTNVGLSLCQDDGAGHITATDMDVATHTLSAPFQGFRALGPRILYVATDSSTCTGPGGSMPMAVTIPLGTGRVLISAFGATGATACQVHTDMPSCVADTAHVCIWAGSSCSPNWGASAIMEPPPTPGLRQSITFMNVTPFDADFGTWSGSAVSRFGSAHALGVAVMPFPMGARLPPNVTFRTTATASSGPSPPNTHEFSGWGPEIAGAAVAWGAFSYTPAGVATAWAVSSPFGAAWRSRFFPMYSTDHP